MRVIRMELNGAKQERDEAWHELERQWNTIHQAIAEHGPLTISKLERKLYPNPNNSPTQRKDRRRALTEYLQTQAEKEAVKLKGKTVSLINGTATQPAQASFDAPGMEHKFEDEEIADLAAAWSIASAARKEAQDAENAAKEKLTEALEARGMERGEQNMPNEARARYSFEHVSGDIHKVYWHTRPAYSGPKIEKPSRGDE